MQKMQTLCELLLIIVGFHGILSVDTTVITQVLDELLQDYDKSIRPGYGESALHVQTNINVRSFGPVSEENMAYSMQCYFRQTWFDSRLQFNLSSVNITELSVSYNFVQKMWRPNTFFLNGKRSQIHNITVPNMFVRIRNDGQIYMSRRLTIRAKCPMKLARYPLDSPMCPLYIGSYGYTSDDLVYNWRFGNNMSVEWNEDLILAQLALDRMYIQNTTLKTHAGKFSRLEVYFYFERHMTYYILNTYLPLYMIVLLSWVSFWINNDAAPARVLLGVTTILSTAGIGLTIKEGLPKVAYATALDVFHNVCLVYNLAALIEYAGVNYYNTYVTSPDDDDEHEALLPEDARLSRRETLKDNDLLLARNFDPMLYSPKKRESCIASFCNCVVGKKRYKTKGLIARADSLGGVSVIDIWSRYLFPCSFIALNIVYWATYLHGSKKSMGHQHER